MLGLIFFVIFGLIVGWIAKLIHPGPAGFWSTALTGIAGSYVGGLLNFLLGRGEFLDASGIVMSILGAVLCLMAWRYWDLQQNQKTFWTGKQK